MIFSRVKSLPKKKLVCGGGTTKTALLNYVVLITSSSLSSQNAGLVSGKQYAILDCVLPSGLQNNVSKGGGLMQGDSLKPARTDTFN